MVEADVQILKRMELMYGNHCIAFPKKVNEAATPYSYKATNRPAGLRTVYLAHTPRNGNGNGNGDGTSS